MVEYPRAGAWSIGFLTAEDVPEISDKLGEPHVAVYISAALNATAGYLVIVPRRQVVELDMSVDEAMKMIITCGVVVPTSPCGRARSAAGETRRLSRRRREGDATGGAGRGAHAGRGHPAAAARARAAAPGAGLRRVPHGPASARRRARRTSASPSHPGTRSSASSRRSDAEVTQFSHRRSRRRALARLHLRRVRILPRREREPVRAGALHRVHAATAATRRRCSPMRATAWRCRATARRAELAPLLCAGLIGYRAYRVAGEPRNLGLYGFGAAAHLLAQVARGQGRRVFAFTRPGDARRPALRARTRRGVGRRLRRAASASGSMPPLCSRPSAR